MATPKKVSAPQPSQMQTTVSGGIGGAIGFLVVMFMPESVHVFTPEQAAGATAAFGVVFNYLARFLPKPPA